MVSKMEEYTSSWSNVFHSVPGEEENTVLSGGAKIKSKISAASTIKTMLMVSGFLQILILVIFLLLPVEYKIHSFKAKGLSLR
jgi:hypothetical protein